MTVVNNADLVEILVPRSLVMEIYRFIAEKSGPTPTKAQRGDTGVTATVLSSNWDAALLKRMYDDSDKNMRSILDYLIARPGQTVTASDLVHVLAQTRDDKKATSQTLAGTLGAFGRRVRSRYKMDRWPFDAKWVNDDGQYHYRMSEEVASQLRG